MHADPGGVNDRADRFGPAAQLDHVFAAVLVGLDRGDAAIMSDPVLWGGHIDRDILEIGNHFLGQADGMPAVVPKKFPLETLRVAGADDGVKLPQFSAFSSIFGNLIYLITRNFEKLFALHLLSLLLEQFK